MTATLVPNTAREIVFFSPLLCFWFTSSPQFNCWWLKHNRKIFDNRNVLIWDKPELAGSWQKPWVHVWNRTWTRTHINTQVPAKSILYQEISYLGAANVHYSKWRIKSRFHMFQASFNADLKMIHYTHNYIRHFPQLPLWKHRMPLPG